MRSDIHHLRRSTRPTSRISSSPTLSPLAARRPTRTCNRRRWWKTASWNPDSGQMNWYFQYPPGDMWDYDEAHTHILLDGQISGQPRKLISHPARNGFLYTFERSNGQTMLAKPYVENINWTAGIDQKTGKPVDYDPKKDIQTYNGKMNQTP